MKRFLDPPAFHALYDLIYGRDLLEGKIHEFAALVSAYNAQHALVDQAAFDAAVRSVLNTVTQRRAYLQATELVE